MCALCGSGREECSGCIAWDWEGGVQWVHCVGVGGRSAVGALRGIGREECSGCIVWEWEGEGVQCMDHDIKRLRDTALTGKQAH